MNKHLEHWLDGGSGVPDPTRCFAVIIAAGLAVIVLLVLAIIGCASVLGCSHLGTIVDAIPTNAVEHVTTTTTTTTTTTQPEAVSAYRITKVTASMIYWTGPDLDWPEKDGCCGESHLYLSNGKGGKFDHVRRNSKSRDWKNVHGGYGAFRALGEPADGEECELVLVSYDGKQRVSVGKFKWVK